MDSPGVLLDHDLVLPMVTNLMRGARPRAPRRRPLVPGAGSRPPARCAEDIRAGAGSRPAASPRGRAGSAAAPGAAGAPRGAPARARGPRPSPRARGAAPRAPPPAPPAPPRPSPRPRAGGGRVVDVALRLELRHHGAGDVGRGAPPGEAARELPGAPGPAREQIASRHPG